MPTKPKKRGGAHNVKDPKDRRVPISVFLAPSTVSILEPYTEKSLRGQVIDLAIGVLLNNGDLDGARRMLKTITRSHDDLQPNSPKPV